MAKLVYIANVSLDGYTEDEQGSFDFTDPDAELLLNPVGNRPDSEPVRLTGGWPRQ